MAAESHLDAIVVGSGPNGLTAAAVLARAGRSVRVVEAAEEIGGGTRTAELTLPGYLHDVCSAIHPMGLASPVFRDLGLPATVSWVQPTHPAAHPLPGGRAAIMERSMEATAARFGADADRYAATFRPLLRAGDDLVDSLLAPLDLPPRHPLALARYGPVGLRSAKGLAHRFRTDEPRALIAGMAAHSMLALDRPITGGFGLFLAMLAHHVGWPMAEGGSAAIATALASLVTAAGGEIVCGERVTSLDQLPPARATILDLTPRQVVAVAGDRLPPSYRRRLERYRYGPGVFKVDWALDGPIPWEHPEVGGAGTVHVGGTFEEVATSEADVAAGRHPDRPFVLLAQQSRFDRTRAPEGGETAWAYCHVPHGSAVDMTDAIEAQVERFAPGFRDRIVARHVMDPAALEAHDANHVGGDIGGGITDLRQFAFRPVASLHPWRTPAEGLYLCSSSTPPGGGVHGMGGAHAARCVLADLR